MTPVSVKPIFSPRYFWMRDAVRNHDKVWIIEVAERDDGVVVRRRWGRRGSKLQQRVEQFNHAINALAHASNLIEEKEAKGYDGVLPRAIGMVDPYEGE